MSSWKSKLIEAYRLTSSPYRACQMLQRRKQGQVPVYVLFYHRVSDCNPNPWTMSCSQFEQQINWFEARFQIVDLEECQRRIQGGFNTQPTLAITFDDGYAENCEFAIPLLIERRIPVTYFVTVDNALHQKPFAHDIENGEQLPINTIESLRALDISGVEIGSHSRSHVDLGKLTDTDEIIDEVITASRELAAQIERKVRYFAFPFGQRKNLNAKVFQLLKREGFLGACTTVGGWNEIGGDPFQITRLHGDTNFARIKNWLSYDPRLANVKQFDYESVQFDLPEIRQSSLFPSSALQNSPSESNVGQLGLGQSSANQYNQF